MSDANGVNEFGDVLRLYRPGADPSPPLRACPAVDRSGVAYVPLGPSLLAIDVNDRMSPVLWSVALDGPIPGPVAVGGDGLARVHAADGLWAFKPGGEPAWGPVRVGPPLGHAAPVVDREGNTYIASAMGGLLQVGPGGVLAPKPRWRSAVRLDSPALLKDGVLYAGGQDHCLYAIALRPDASSWDHERGRGRTGCAVQGSPTPARSGKHGDLWIVAGRDGILIAFDAEGQVVWKIHTGGPMLGSPVITPDGHLVVGVTRSSRSRDAWGELACVSPDTGESIWTFSADGPVESTPVVGSDGVIYFGDNAQILYAIGVDGRLIASVHHRVAIRSALSLWDGGRLAFGQDDGAFSVVACRSSRLASSGWPKFRGDEAQSGSMATD